MYREKSIGEEYIGVSESWGGGLRGVSPGEGVSPGIGRGEAGRGLGRTGGVRGRPGYPSGLPWLVRGVRRVRCDMPLFAGIGWVGLGGLSNARRYGRELYACVGGIGGRGPGKQFTIV